MLGSWNLCKEKNSTILKNGWEIIGLKTFRVGKTASKFWLKLSQNTPPFLSPTKMHKKKKEGRKVSNPGLGNNLIAMFDGTVDESI